MNREAEQTDRRSVLIQPCRLDARFQKLAIHFWRESWDFPVGDICQRAIAFFAIRHVFSQ